MLSSLAQPALLLAQRKSNTSEIFFWLGVIVALAIVMGFAALWLRKRLMATPQQPPMGFTLKDLRELHVLGQISDEELARAEEKALNKTRLHYLGSGEEADEAEEASEDVGHLSTGSEDDEGGGTENSSGPSDKNPGGGPGA